MSSLKSLRARLRRLKQQLAQSAADEIDVLLRQQPISVLIEFAAGGSNLSPRMQAALEELAPECADEDELIRRLIERLAADVAAG